MSRDMKPTFDCQMISHGHGVASSGVPDGGHTGGDGRQQSLEWSACQSAKRALRRTSKPSRYDLQASSSTLRASVYSVT